MSLTLAIKQLFSTEQNPEWLMTQYSHSGDSDQLAKLYDMCSSDLYHFLLTLSDPAQAEDIAQRTWLKVIEKRHLYQATGKFKAWLFTMGRRILIDEIRKQGRFSELDEKHAPNVTPIKSNNDIEEAFDHALMSLPFVQREAFTLQQEGFGLQQISDITHSSIEATKSRLRYAKQSLRQSLSPYQSGEDRG